MRNWEAFERFQEAINKHMPARGEGETMASQLATAINTLIYRWFIDGDVYDNQTDHGLGWANNISSRANWIHKNIAGAADILESVWTIQREDDPEEAYTEILWKLADTYTALLDDFANIAKTGSIYNEAEPFKYTIPEDDD